jgi:hypothetical protein
MSPAEFAQNHLEYQPQHSVRFRLQVCVLLLVGVSSDRCAAFLERLTDG